MSRKRFFLWQVLKIFHKFWKIVEIFWKIVDKQWQIVSNLWQLLNIRNKDRVITELPWGANKLWQHKHILIAVKIYQNCFWILYQNVCRKTFFPFNKYWKVFTSYDFFCFVWFFFKNVALVTNLKQFMTIVKHWKHWTILNSQAELIKCYQKSSKTYLKPNSL